MACGPAHKVLLLRLNAESADYLQFCSLLDSAKRTFRRHGKQTGSACGIRQNIVESPAWKWICRDASCCCPLFCRDAANTKWADNRVMKQCVLRKQATLRSTLEGGGTLLPKTLTI